MKMTFVKGCLLALTAGLFTANAAMAQDQAGSLDELLNMVQENKISESQEAQARLAEFRQQKNQQQQLLQEAEDIRAAEEQRAERLEATYEEQEIEVAAKIAQRNERLGSLRELFGHLTSTAGDLRATIDSSIVSAQYPERGEFLNDLIDKMNSNTRLPSIEEIEQLWFELQREMIASGQVVEFPGVVIKPNGETSEQQVVRIGTYNLVSNGKYLQFMPDDNQMMELPRQPDGSIQESAANLQAAETGLVRTGIDPTGPTGGSLLAALIQSPTWEERWHQGGGVGYVITAVGIFGFILGIWRIIYLTGVSAKVSSQLKSSTPNTNNPLGRVLQVAEDNKHVDPETLELKLEEAVLKERPKIESGLALLKIIAAVAPLMGLLGTVVGMILTFQAITIFGAGDPKNMAGGISSALITTVLGLLVAIPTVLLHTLVNGRAKRVIHVLDEQTAGIIAENSERK